MNNDLRADEDLREDRIVRDIERGSRRRRLSAVVALAAVTAFGGGVWYAYDHGVRKGQVPPPVIKAETGPTKVAPQNPGGIQIPNQDKQVYERLNPSQPKPPATAERLLPPPERPAPQTAPIPRPPVAAGKVEPPAAVASAPEAAKAEVVPTAASPTADARPADAAVSQGKAAAVQPAEKAPAAEKTLAAPAKVAGVTSPVAAAKPPGSGVRIQLAAYRDTEAAQAAWKRLQKQFSDPLGPLSSSIEMVDLGSKGVFHRLQAGPFADRVMAAAACEKLKAKSQGCVIVGQ